MSTLDAIHRRSIALLAVGAVLTFTLAPARAADSPTLDEIAAKLKKQRASVQSVFIELHDYTTISVPTDVLLSWPEFHNLLALVDQRHEFAFKGPKRYWLEERLNPPQMLRKIKQTFGQPNSCRGDNGHSSWSRALGDGGNPARAFNLTLFAPGPIANGSPRRTISTTSVGWTQTRNRRTSGLLRCVLSI